MSDNHDAREQSRKKRRLAAHEGSERDRSNALQSIVAGREAPPLVSVLERMNGNMLSDPVAALQHPLFSSSRSIPAAAASVPVTAPALQVQGLIAELIRLSSSPAVLPATDRTSLDWLQSLLPPVHPARPIGFTQSQQTAAPQLTAANMGQLCSILAALQAPTAPVFPPAPAPPSVAPNSADATQAALLVLLPLLQSVTAPSPPPPPPPALQGLLSNPLLLQEALALVLRSQSGSLLPSVSVSDVEPTAPPLGVPTRLTTNRASSSVSSLSQTPQPVSRSMLLSIPSDAMVLSEYQVLLREQIELFEATPDDTRPHDQGRKRQVVVGQVGIRCRFCHDVVRAARSRGAVYFPVRMENLYQAGQNMGSNHFCRTCPRIPPDLKEKMVQLAQESSRSSTSGSGKKYWSDGVKALGVVEHENGGLRFTDP